MTEFLIFNLFFAVNDKLIARCSYKTMSRKSVLGNDEFIEYVNEPFPEESFKDRKLSSMHPVKHMGFSRGQ